ncbi:Fructosamine kinase-domain-containing protein [Xylariomycetidae sp. FL0641]|nr:Fructosamine kinase-domain-containing protein [Xylariomycetidae sp. FL0641]
MASGAAPSVAPTPTTSGIDPSQDPYAPDILAGLNLPPGTGLLSVTPCGKSEWTTTARLRVRVPSPPAEEREEQQQQQQEEEDYFLKLLPSRAMARGEFAGLEAICRFAPELAPRPHAWGACSRALARAVMKGCRESSSSPLPATALRGEPSSSAGSVAEEEEEEEEEGPSSSFFFLLTEYLPDLIPGTTALPDPAALAAALAGLHRRSSSESGRKTFGFPVPTFQGRVRQAVAEELPSWPAFFAALLRHVAARDAEANGPWPALAALAARVRGRVVPRLLGALGPVAPALVHGDLWEGNVGTDGRGRVRLFDAACYWAHAEMDVAGWRAYYNRISEPRFRDAYWKVRQPDEPRAEAGERERLYSVYYNVIYSVNHREAGRAVRQLAYSDMYALVEKYAPFPEDERPPRLEASQMAKLSAERDHTL